MSKSVLAVVVLALLGTSALAGPITFGFDGLSGGLSDYAPQGLTFSSNASVWTWSGASVLTDPNGGARSLPSALQFGNAGGVLGSIFFALPQTSVSIWALSGPGPDNLSNPGNPLWIKAYDAANQLVAQDFGDTSVQFDLLAVSGTGIRRLDVWSPDAFDDVWDDMTIDNAGVSAVVPLPSAAMMGAGLLGLALALGRLRRRRD